jgi:hypothetical protein
MRRNLLLLACVPFGLILSAIGPVTAQIPLPSLAGSWELTFVPASATSSGPVAPFPGLATFTPDGSVIETDGSEVVPRLNAAGTTATYSTPGHGIWQPSPAVGYLYIQFISLRVNQNSTLRARKIVTMSGALDATGNHFSGNYGYELVSPAGHIIMTGSGTVTGQKIPHPLLP